MKKKLMVCAATGLALLVAGCSSNSDRPPSTSGTTTTTTESYSIDSWTNWGRAGQEWLAKCEDYAWGCYADQVDDLETAATTLPDDETKVRALRVTGMYLETYERFVQMGCLRSTSAPATCNVTAQQLGTMHGYVENMLTSMVAN